MRFNPCSIGFSFRSYTGAGCAWLRVLFQSLFYWIFLSETPDQPAKAGFSLRFNPCSIGFSFRRYNDRYRLPKKVWVSILVLLDFPFGEGARERRKPLILGFQSLFYWIFLSEAAPFPGPCNRLKVSILVLLDFPFGVGAFRCFLRRDGKFQSLFYWIFLSETGEP